jgi:hypothetical protein
MAARRLDFPEPFRPGFWLEILQAAQPGFNIDIERRSQQRVHFLHAAARYLQHGFNDGIILRRALGNPAVQFGAAGARKRRLNRSIDTVDRGVLEHDGGTLRNVGQSADAAAAAGPVHLQRRRLTAIGQRGRRLEFGDQEFRLVDLRDHHDFAEPRGERLLRARRLRKQRNAGVVAANLESEREACDLALAAGIDPAGFCLLRGPGVGAHAGFGRSIEPERAPCRGGDDEQCRHDEQAPQRAPARRGGRVRHAASFG